MESLTFTSAELVSTLIPVRNRACLLAEAVASVQAQDHPSTEIIIVDDGSSDDTAAVAQALLNRHPGNVQLVRHQQPGGPGFARQQALRLARGAFIQYLDSDDLLLPGKFSAQVEAFRRHPEADICFGRSFQENHRTQPPCRTGPIRGTGEAHTALFPLLLRERWWTTSTPLYRRSLVERIGPWLPLINEEDWEYDARAGALGARLVWIDQDVSVRRIGIDADHLSDAGDRDPRKLRDRSQARLAIHSSALKAGVAVDAPEMEHFISSVFLLCRQCGLAGLEEEARVLFDLVDRGASHALRLRSPIRTYAFLARRLGWSRTARLGTRLYSLLHPFAGGQPRPE